MTVGDLRAAAKRWKQHLKSLDDGKTTTLVGVVGSHTTEPIEASLGVGLLDLGVSAPRIVFADFGQIHNVCLDPESAFGTKIDHILILIRIEDIFSIDTRSVSRLDESAAKRILAEFADLGQLISNLATTSGMEITVALPPSPVPPGIDTLDPMASIPLGQLQYGCCTQLLQAFDGAASIRVIDTQAIVTNLGKSNAYDQFKWAMYRQPYGRAMWSELGRSAALAISRRLIPPPKCIVVDCDNTLWGGIVGEDGVGGIALGEDFPGRCYTEFQQTLLDAHERGTLIGICSKNEEQDVLDVFEKHDAMQLKHSDVAAWRVNWSPKSENISSIATELNIGLDSIVFIDDSNFEISEVSSSLPMVTCLQVPEETALLPSLLSDSRLFAMVTTTSEDLSRTQMILAESARKDAGKTMDRETFLASLQLHVTIERAQPEQLGRVTQLINKTNQFNLTTIRRTEAEVSALAQDDSWTVWAMTVKDKFGDSGLVGVAIVDVNEPIAKIDTLLMSCRVLGRGIETALLAVIVSGAFEIGATAVRGKYLATQKNAQVAALYENHGFAPIDDGLFDIEPAEDLIIPTHLEVEIR